MNKSQIPMVDDVNHRDYFNMVIEILICKTQLTVGIKMKRGNMIVTGIEQIGKEKFKVNTDEGTIYILYKSELKKYAVEENEEFDYVKIEEMLEKKAKKKVLEWLKFSDRTKEELMQKLRQAGYEKQIAQKAVEYAASYGYLDEQRYGRNYVEYKGKYKSKRQLEIELKNKGLSREEIEQSLEECQYNENDALEKVFQKKIGKRKIEEMEYEEKQKIASYLLRKGFNFEGVRQKLDL